MEAWFVDQKECKHLCDDVISYGNTCAKSLLSLECVCHVKQEEHMESYMLIVKGVAA